MQATYDAFVEKAAAGRKTTPERIDADAQGRVWTGAQAKQIGLVDELGGLERALALAKQRAGSTRAAEVELVVYPQRKSFYDWCRRRSASEGGRLRADWLPGTARRADADGAAPVFAAAANRSH